jgi:hypothetical protein
MFGGTPNFASGGFTLAPDAILIFGPGEAKGELEKRLASKRLGAKVVGVETADKMTDHQIEAKVRQHYQKPADALAP